MEVLGLAPVTMTLIICVAGVSFRIFQGMQGKSIKDFNINLALTTLVIGVISSIGLIAPVMETIPENTDSLIQLQVVAAQFAIVIGVDAAVRKGYKYSKKLTEQQQQEEGKAVDNGPPEDEPAPIDDPDDLPPGKDEEPQKVKN